MKDIIKAKTYKNKKCYITTELDAEPLKNFYSSNICCDIDIYDTNINEHNRITLYAKDLFLVYKIADLLLKNNFDNIPVKNFRDNKINYVSCNDAIYIHTLFSLIIHYKKDLGINIYDGLIYKALLNSNIKNKLFYLYSFNDSAEVLKKLQNILKNRSILFDGNNFILEKDSNKSMFIIDEKDIYYSNDSYKDYISIFTSSYLNDYKTFSKYASKYMYYDNYITKITLNKKDVEMLKHKYFIDKKINDQIYISSDGLVLEKVNSYKYKYDDEFCSYVEQEDFTGTSCIVGGTIYDY